MVERTRVEIEGDERFAATSALVAAQLGDLSILNGIVARYVASRAAVYAPKDTGRLAYSIRGYGEPDASVAGSDLIYAPVQERGWPGHNIEPHRFLGRAADETAPEAVRAHLANLNLLLAHIEGA